MLYVTWDGHRHTLTYTHTTRKRKKETDADLPPIDPARALCSLRPPHTLTYQCETLTSRHIRDATCCIVPHDLLLLTAYWAWLFKQPYVDRVILSHPDHELSSEMGPQNGQETRERVGHTT